MLSDSPIEGWQLRSGRHNSSVNADHAPACMRPQTARRGSRPVVLATLVGFTTELVRAIAAKKMPSKSGVNIPQTEKVILRRPAQEVFQTTLSNRNGRRYFIRIFAVRSELVSRDESNFPKLSPNDFSRVINFEGNLAGAGGQQYCS